MESVSESWSRSPCETIKISHVWTIEKFSLRDDKEICSSTFTSSQDDFDSSGNKREWVMKCRRVLIIDDNDNYLVLLVKTISPMEIESINYSISLLDYQGNCLQSTQTSRHDKGVMSVVLKMTEILGKLPTDVLKIKCELSYLKKVENVSGTGTEKSARKKRKCDLSDNLGTLLTDDEFSDVTICVGMEEKTEFKAHKNILAARSSYFSAMFKNNFKEKRENRVEINGVNPETFKEILAFIYTGKEPDEDMSENDTIQLLKAADLFNLETLKSITEDFLASKLSIENASELLVVAYRHSADSLKTRATDYIAANLKQVMKTEGWEEMILEYPYLIQDPIFKAFGGSSEKD